jgi:hypothetical protein
VLVYIIFLVNSFPFIRDLKTSLFADLLFVSNRSNPKAGASDDEREGAQHCSCKKSLAGKGRKRKQPPISHDCSVAVLLASCFFPSHDKC